MSERKPPRIGPSPVPERYDLPGRPANASPDVQDAHRQTQFLLSSDLDVFQRAMNLQLAMASEAAKTRTPEAAALLGLWARTFACLDDSTVLLGRASYSSCPPLLRTACDCIAAQRSLLADGFGEFADWLAEAFDKDTTHSATSLGLGRYRGGSALAEEDRLGAAYRLLTDLTMPHFGATALQTGPDSTAQRLALAFADNAFHLGLAELVAGWLLLLAGAQLETSAGAEPLDVGQASKEEAARIGATIREALAGPRRCHAQELPDGRRLIHNFRRAVSGAPKRLLL
jgi:hypothetical protein